jgi:hypothetical protein
MVNVEGCVGNGGDVVRERKHEVKLGVVENDWSNSQVEFRSKQIKYNLHFFSPRRLAIRS